MDEMDTKQDCSIQLYVTKYPTAGLLQEEVCWQYPDLKENSLFTHRDYAKIETF